MSSVFLNRDSLVRTDRARSSTEHIFCSRRDSNLLLCQRVYAGLPHLIQNIPCKRVCDRLNATCLIAQEILFYEG